VPNGTWHEDIRELKMPHDDGREKKGSAKVPLLSKLGMAGFINSAGIARVRKIGSWR
jgi:hypothetical protein